MLCMFACVYSRYVGISLAFSLRKRFFFNIEKLYEGVFVSVEVLVSDAERRVIMVKVKFAQGVYLHLVFLPTCDCEAEVRFLTDDIHSFDQMTQVSHRVKIPMRAGFSHIQDLLSNHLAI